MASKQTILGFDPGRDKCGVAVMDCNNQIVYHQIVDSQRAIATINRLSQAYKIDLVVMGNGTTSRDWQKLIESDLVAVPVVAVDEKNSTLEARDRYWVMYPPKRLQRMIPQGLRIPPRPLDDIVAILLIERYLAD
ncbi:pre-16S rRNA-processing nuclease YqgF [Pleurocapsales cyanobacterium LEGE 10410]|nr:pre-16S rRNA-processing nuclease YqgF [Pleurocapsales cyanobacterium LEGE 10410]